MKCEHCGSSDIVLIQGKNYCLNCGEPSAQVDPAPTPTPVEEPQPAVVAAVVKPPKKPRAKKATTKKPKAKPQPDTPTYAAAAAPSPKVGRRASDLVKSSAAVSRPQRSEAPTGTRLRPHPLRFTLIVAGLLGTFVAAVTALSLGFQFDAGLTLYVVGLSAVVAFGFMALAQGALYYGLARTMDGRPAPRARWWMAARSGFMDVLSVRIVSLISLVVAVAVAAISWRLLGQPDSHQTAPVLLVIVVNAVVAWFGVGTYIAERMAMPAVIVGGLTAFEAFKVGWRLYVKAGGHLVVTAFEALMGRLIILVMLGLVVAGASRAVPMPEASGWQVMVAALTTGVACFGLAIIILEVDVSLWLRQYRRVAGQLEGAERVRLLTGRVQTHAQS